MEIRDEDLNELLTKSHNHDSTGVSQISQRRLIPGERTGLASGRCAVVGYGSGGRAPDHGPATDREGGI